MKNTDKLIHYLKDDQTTVTDMAEHLSISRQAVHRILNRLLAQGVITTCCGVWSVVKMLRLWQSCIRRLGRNTITIE